MLQYLGSILSMDRHDTPFNISNANVRFFFVSFLKYTVKNRLRDEYNRLDGASCECFSNWLAKLYCRWEDTVQQFLLFFTCHSILQREAWACQFESVNWIFIIYICFCRCQTQLGFFFSMLWNWAFVFAKWNVSDFHLHWSTPKRIIFNLLKLIDLGIRGR